MDMSRYINSDYKSHFLVGIKYYQSFTEFDFQLQFSWTIEVQFYLQM